MAYIFRASIVSAACVNFARATATRFGLTIIKSSEGV